MTTDRGPHASMYVTGFDDVESFRQWCRDMTGNGTKKRPEKL